MNLNDLFNEEKVRLDPKCWTGKKIGNPKTKVKGGVRVNNCVPAESVAEGSKMARVDKSAKAPKPEDQQEYDAVEKYRKDLAQSYNKEPNFGIKDDEEENKWWIDYDLDEGVAEGVMYGAENLHVGDDVIISGNVELNGATGVIDSFGQDKRFVVVDLYNHGKHSFHSSDVSANDYDNDEHDDLDETRRGQVPMTLKPGETENLEPEDFAGFKKLPAYQQGFQAQQQAGKQLIQKSPYTFQSDQDWAYRQGATDAQRAGMFANFGGTKPLTTTTENTLDEKSVSQAQFRTMAGAAHNPEFAKKVGISQDVAQEFHSADKHSNYKKLPDRANEGEQQKGADYRDPKEVDYDDEYDAMVARVKKLAGLGPMKTVYDPNRRVYRNMPTAQQPKK